MEFPCTRAAALLSLQLFGCPAPTLGTPYDREHFGGWADAYGDCRNTRHEILEELSMRRPRWSPTDAGWSQGGGIPTRGRPSQPPSRSRSTTSFLSHGLGTTARTNGRTSAAVPSRWIRGTCRQRMPGSTGQRVQMVRCIGRRRTPGTGASMSFGSAGSPASGISSCWRRRWSSFSGLATAFAGERLRSSCRRFDPRLREGGDYLRIRHSTRETNTLLMANLPRNFRRSSVDCQRLTPKVLIGLICEV